MEPLLTKPRDEARASVSPPYTESKRARWPWRSTPPRREGDPGARLPSQPEPRLWRVTARSPAPETNATSLCNTRPARTGHSSRSRFPPLVRLQRSNTRCAARGASARNAPLSRESWGPPYVDPGVRVSKALIFLERGPPPARTGQTLGVCSRHLVPIANRPLLLHAIEGLERAGVDQVGVAAEEAILAATQEALASHPTRLYPTYILSDGASALEAVLAARGFLEGDATLIHSGDGVFGPGLRGVLEAFDERGLDALCVLESSIGTTRRGVDKVLAAREPSLLGAGGRARDFSGLSVLGPAALRAAEEAGQTKWRPSWADLIAALDRLHASVETQMMDDWCRCRAEDGRSLLRVTRAALDLVEAKLPHAVQEGCDVEVQGRVAIDPTASLESTTIRGPVVVGPRSSISDAFLGPYTSIGEDVVIEGSEIENSIVLDGARISHLRDRLDGSILGRSSKVSVAFDLPRGMRLVLGEGGEVVLS